ncbi:zinc finger protein RFP-like [Lissotriton helveticus]
MEEATQLWKEKIRIEIEELQRILEEEKYHILSSLERQQREILHNIRQNVTELVKQRSSLTALQTEIAGRCQLTDLELLKDIKSTLNRYDSLEVLRSKLNSPELEINLQSFKQQYNSLQEAIYVLIETFSKELEWNHSFNFKEIVAAELDWRQVQRFSRVVFLDSSTASRWINVSEDLKGAIAQIETDVEDTPDRYDEWPCVLGRERLTSGKHYWEVQVGDAKEWKLGVCDETANRRGDITVAPYRGYWAVGRKSEDIYISYTSPSQTPLSPSMPLRTVGIFLDIEAGRVAFYNLEQRTLLFCFPRYPLPRTLRPYFCTWDLTSPLLII